MIVPRYGSNPIDFWSITNIGFQIIGINVTWCGSTAVLLLIWFLRIKIVIISNFLSGFHITSAFREARLTINQNTNTKFLLHHHLGQKTSLSSNLNHFGCFCIECNYPSNTATRKGNSLPPSTTWSSLIASLVDDKSNDSHLNEHYTSTSHEFDTSSDDKPNQKTTGTVTSIFF